MTILDCGHEPSPHSEYTTGYGTDSNGAKHCWACCAECERQSMLDTSEACLYFVERDDGYYITDWTGFLEFQVWPSIKKSHHNFAVVRYDYWFVGPDYHFWHGYTIGDNTQIAHCKRTKRLFEGKRDYDPKTYGLKNV